MLAFLVKIGECIICEAVAEIMYRIMANPNVDHSINHVLEKACRALPSRDQEKVRKNKQPQEKHITLLFLQCTTLIEKYGADLYQIIAHMSNPSAACREIGICFLSEAHYRATRGLVGSSKCTWGPSYWCESLSNAQDCGRGVS